MRTTHHLTEQMLLGYSAGVLPEAFNLVVASHLYLSDGGHDMQCCYDAIGGEVLSKCDKANMSADALTTTLKQIKTCPCDTQAPEICTSIFPAPLQEYVGDKLDSICWCSLGRGIRQTVVPTTKGATARLLFVPAGQVFPHRKHTGTEVILVLQGTYHTGDKHFGRGDIDACSCAGVHRPIADSDQDCICLTACDSPSFWTPWWQKLLSRHRRVRTATKLP